MPVLSVRQRRTAHFIAAASIFAAGLFGPAAAQGEPFPPDRWVVDWGDQRCSLIRQMAGDPVRIFALRTTPGSRVWEIRIVNRGWPDRFYADAGQMSLRLEPQGTVLPGQFRSEETPAGRALILYGLQPQDIDAIGRATDIRIIREGAQALEMRLPGLPRAVTGLRQCEVGVLREWGIDPVAFYAVREPPRGNLASVIDDNDYPMESLARGEQGSVVMRLTINPEGRVENCSVVLSSGHEPLDRKSCLVATRRFRPAPAIGANGAPTQADMIVSINWRILS